MSGFGERFRRAGYTVPKPLISVDGKPIIAHVIDMFPGEKQLVFVCNQDHLANSDYKMAQVLRDYAPDGKIVPIEPHKLGPVNAVLAARDYISADEPTIVNYCDFTCYWDYTDFCNMVSKTACSGAIPAYKGFHPHCLGSTYYAYVRETGLWVSDIQEKKPFTDQPMSEYASSGTYYFSSGSMCVNAFEQQMKRQDLRINDEFYASLSYKILLEENLDVAVYPLQHFMQWGTPADLEGYQGWSSAFRQLAADNQHRARHSGSVLIPMAGAGSRFVKAGYDLPKPLIEVSGRPMVIQATLDLPDAPIHRFVLRKDLPSLEMITKKLRSSYTGTETAILEGLTEGQAITCLEGMEGLEDQEPVTVGACDNGVLYDVAQFEELMDDEATDVIVWVVRGHADGKAKPQMFGWVEADIDGTVRDVSVKKALADPATDPMIIGTFTFKKAENFKRAAESLVRRNQRINNEFYVDSLIWDAIQLGLKVKIFEVDAYLGWGTPDDLDTFKYWQSCFHKWQSHPYRLDKDRRIPVSKRDELAEAYKHIAADYPSSTK